MNSLYHLKDDKEYIVTKTPGVHLLDVLGIFEGSKITKKATYKNGGPVLVSVNGREIAIGRDYAMAIEVKEQEVTSNE